MDWGKSEKKGMSERLNESRKGRYYFSDADRTWNPHNGMNSSSTNGRCYEHTSSMRGAASSQRMDLSELAANGEKKQEKQESFETATTCDGDGIFELIAKACGLGVCSWIGMIW